MFCFLVGFFSDESSELLTTLKRVANGLRDDFRFAFSTTKEVVDEYQFDK